VKVKLTDGGHRIDGDTVSNSKLEHVEGGVPASRYIPGHHTQGKTVSGKRLVPARQEDGRRVLECERNFP